jgi:hypothetical protein
MGINKESFSRAVTNYTEENSWSKRWPLFGKNEIPKELSAAARNSYIDFYWEFVESER